MAPCHSSSSLILSSLELSDKKVYETSIRVRLGTAARFCEVVVLKLRHLVSERVVPRDVDLRLWEEHSPAGTPNMG